MRILTRVLLTFLLALEGLAYSRAEASSAFHQQGTVAIDGWSSGSETTADSPDGVSPILLEPGHPELVLLFHKQGAGGEPALFRYRLRSFDDGWTETREHVAHFWKLPPGDYQFEVAAALPDGSWPASATTLQVKQKPFFYQTWYADVMVGLFVLAVSVQLLRQRDQLLKGQIAMVLEERNRIASECHDTLMASFAAVNWQLEATAQTLATEAPEERGSATSLELARSMVSHCQAEARRIIWDLRSSDRITTRLSESLANAIEAHRLSHDTETRLDVQGDEVTLSPAAVHHLTCIGQEAITNAIRHAKSSLIQVRLQYEVDSLSLAVRDDGCGFALQGSQSKTGHFGIPVMEERARKLGGQFRLTSTFSRGTEVLVTVKFNGICQPVVENTAVIPWIGL